jgi:polar amino acid transport system substrate-binding protein
MIRSGLLSFILFCSSLHAQTLELLTEDGPPHNMLKGGKIVGMSTEKLESAFKQLGMPFHAQLMPWSRAFQLTLANSNYCIYTTARTAEREHLFQWVGPITYSDWVLYTLADNPVKVSKIEDVRDEIIGGYSQTEAITVWLLEHGFHVDTGAADDMNPQKLMKRRFKYWADSKVTGTLLLKQQGLSKNIIPVLTFGHSEMYLACNLGVDRALIDKLNRVLEKMRADGEFARIDARYLR